MLLELTPEQQIKYNMIKIFLLSNLEGIKELYCKVNDCKNAKITLKNWFKFVNSQELHDMIYAKISALSPKTREIIAHCEVYEQLGFEICVEGGVSYVAMPFETSYNLKMNDVEKGIIQHATRAFIIGMTHRLFKILYKKPFVITKGSQRVSLNYELDYVVD